MRIFLAGATGLIGTKLLPLLLAEGHEVAGMTRTAAKLPALKAAGAEPVLCDVYDRAALTAAVTAFRPEAVMHQLTDLPDRLEQLADYLPGNGRIRTEGTRNLLDAAAAAGATRLVVQSIAWPGGPSVEAHDRMCLDAGASVLRYGQFYGPGTYYETALPPAPRISVDEAARRTLPFLDGPAGLFTLVEDEAA